MGMLKSYKRSKNCCKELPKAFCNVRDELHSHDALILKNSQLVVPVAVLADIHKGQVT